MVKEQQGRMVQRGAAPKIKVEEPDMGIQEEEVTPEDLDKGGEHNPITKMDEALSGGDSEVPDWVELPEDFAFPPGRKVGFIRLRAAWTERLDLGDRVLVCWTLSESEEKLAYERANGKGYQAVAELSKQTIRVIDGHKANWARQGGVSDVHKFWSDLPTKCRQLIETFYLKTHTMTQEESMDFFANCFVVRSAVGG